MPRRTGICGYWIRAQHLRGADDVAALCARHEPLARQLLADAWWDPEFIASYAQWTIDILLDQKHYHACLALRQHALLHRVHRVTSGLFGLTALGALMHLLIHTLWLSLVTTFFPALGASLHGALAQSEAYRLGATSERLVVELQGDRWISAPPWPSRRKSLAFRGSRHQSKLPSRSSWKSTRTGTCWCGRTTCRWPERAGERSAPASASARRTARPGSRSRPASNSGRRSRPRKRSSKPADTASR
jgi:hypothetical protein